MGKLGAGALDHVHVSESERAKAAALEEDRFLAQEIFGEGDAAGADEDGVSQAAFHQCHSHEAVVHGGEGRAGELEHIHLDALGGQIVHERFDDDLGALVVVESGVDEVDADDAESFLLGDIFAIPHTDMEEDLAGLGEGTGLETNPQPTVAIILAGVAAGGYGVGKNEKSGAVAAGLSEPFLEQGPLVLEHGDDPFFADIAFAGSVDGIAESHVISGHAFGHCASGAADLEKPAGDFLAGTDLGKGAVALLVQVDAERFLVCLEDIPFHAVWYPTQRNA